jgi:hypothetical protein
MSKFAEYAPRIMRDLIAEPGFGFGVYDAAAIVGNAGHESGGLEKMQEIAPVVKGSRGGYGWFQWTGPRRRAFEKWAKAKGLSVDSYEANYGFLVHELRGPEKSAVAKTKAAKTLDAKVKAFELAYERAGVKHYPSRNRWARRALELYEADEGPIETERAGPSPLIIEAAQKRLKELGYPVGYVDGKAGPLTAGALAAFQTVAGLPVTGALDDATLARLSAIDAPSKPVSEERQSATVQDLRAAGSKTVKEADKVSGTSLWTVISSGFALIVGAIGEFFSGAWDMIEPLRMALASVPWWVWVALALIIALQQWHAAQKVKEARLDDERSGRNVGLVTTPKVE